MKYNRVGGAAYPGGTEFTTKRNEEKARNARFVAKMEGLVRRWDLEVDKLAAQGEGAAAEAREAGLARIAAMRAEGEAARASLRQLRYATQASSRGLLLGCERAWTSMTTALAKLAAEPAKESGA